jgi:hypothetical protein
MNRAAFAAKSVTTLAILVFGCAYTFFRTFSSWVAYDDEGLLMYAIRNFLAGNALYDETLTQYGPAYYFIHALIFEAMAVPLTHDGMRIVSLAWWLSGSALSGLVVARVTSSIQAGWACFFCSVVVASVIAKEPGHPLALLYALTSLGGLAAASNRTWQNAVVLGVAAGLIAATKINVGFLFWAAIVWWFLSLGRNNRTVSLLWWCCALGILAMPAVLMADLLHLWRFRDLAIVATIATANLVIVSRPNAIASDNMRPAVHVVVIAVGAFLACCGFAVVTGTSIAGLLDGLILQHIGFAGEFYAWPPTVRPWQMAAIALSVPSLGLYQYAVGRPKWKMSARWIASVGQIVFGIVVFFGLLSQWKRFGLTVPWMWLAVVDTAPDSESESRIRRRLPLLALASLLFLQAYPVAASHWSFVMAPLIPLSWICIANGMRAIPILAKSTVIAPWLCVVLRSAVLIATVVAFLGMIRESQQRYDEGAEPVSLKGTSLLRIPEDRLAVVETVALNVRHNAKRLFTVPGMYSFFLWTGAESPTLLNQGNWPIALRDDEQEEVVAQLEDAAGLLVVRNEMVLQFWNRPNLKRFGPAVEYVEREFERIASVGGYHIMAPRAARSEFRLVGARWLGDDEAPNRTERTEYAVIHAPPVGGTIRNAKLGSSGHRVLFDAKKTEGGPFLTLDESGRVVTRRSEIDLNDWRTFVVAVAWNERSYLGKRQFVQLLDESKEIVLRFCFLDPLAQRADIRASQ